MIVRFASVSDVREFVGLATLQPYAIDVVDGEHVVSAKNFMELFTINFTHPLHLLHFSSPNIAKNTPIRSDGGACILIQPTTKRAAALAKWASFRLSVGRCRGRRPRRPVGHRREVRAGIKMAKTKGLSLRGGQRPTWRPEREARGSALGVQSREGSCDFAGICLLSNRTLRDCHVASLLAMTNLVACAIGEATLQFASLQGAQ